MPKHDKRARKKSPPFINLPHYVKLSQAYWELSCLARAALIELIDGHNGHNNGFIRMGVRRLAEQLGCSRDTANRALRELSDADLIRPTEMAHWQSRRETEWRLMWLQCDRTHERARWDWMPRSSADHSPMGRTTQYDGSDTKAASEPSQSDGSDANAKKPNDSKIDSPTDRTHLDLPCQGALNGRRMRTVAALAKMAGVEIPSRH